MPEVAPERSLRTTHPLWVRLIAVVLVALGAAGPAAARSQANGDVVNVERLSARAAAWSAAHLTHQQAAVERAIALGEAASAAEAAAEEAERRAVIEAAAVAATSVPPTTMPAPSTTSTTTTTTTTTTTAAPPADDEADTQPASPDSTTTTTSTTAPTSGPTPEQWEALRQCESGGRYDALSPGGRYRGAYQFSQSTWDWVASWANSSLVGVDPAAASVADQDAQAQALFDRQGAGPWPHCGTYLP